MHPGTVSTRIRVGIVSTEPIRQAGLCGVFEDHAKIVLVPGELETLLEDDEIRFLIVDFSSNLTTAWTDLLFGIRRARPDIRHIVLGPVGNDELVIRAITAGARAYLDCNSGSFEVRKAVESVIAGSIWAPRHLLSILIDRLLEGQAQTRTHAFAEISPRERQVLDLVMEAHRNREIATQLGIEERTVKAYVSSLMRKTGAENRVSLSVMATQELLVESRRVASN